MLKYQNQKSPRINIIPLIDIIFLMLVFFMLATNFNKTKEISFSVSNQKQAVNESDDQSIMIINIKNNELFVQNKMVDLKNLETEYFEKWESLNFDKIVILNDKKSSIQSLILILDSIKKNKITGVNFSDEP